MGQERLLFDTIANSTRPEEGSKQRLPCGGMAGHTRSPLPGWSPPGDYALVTGIGSEQYVKM